MNKKLQAFALGLLCIAYAAKAAWAIAAAHLLPLISRAI
jgi:hypothetical protein